MSKCLRLTLYLPESARFETDPQDIQRPAPKRCFSQAFHQCSTANPSKHASYIKYLLCNMYHSIVTLTQRPAKSGSQHGGLPLTSALRRPPPTPSEHWPERATKMRLVCVPPAALYSACAIQDTQEMVTRVRTSMSVITVLATRMRIA
jgi:hypothetical protein